MGFNLCHGKAGSNITKEIITIHDIMEVLGKKRRLLLTQSGAYKPQNSMVGIGVSWNGFQHPSSDWY